MTEETPTVLMARTLLAQCLLHEAKYAESQTEAELILETQKNNSVALLVQGETLYFQCQVRPLINCLLSLACAHLLTCNYC